MHGQLLAWRRDLEVLPALGVAADDLDLMLQVRARGLAVRLVPAARFHERKPAPGRARDLQALRRARAGFACLRAAHGAPERTPADRLGRAQVAAYRVLAPSAPALALVLLATAHLVAWELFGLAGLAVLALALVAAVLAGVARPLLRLGAILMHADRLEASESQSDRWETARR